MNNIIGTIFFYFTPILLGTLLLIFWRNITIHEANFPTRFHIFLYFILSFVPVVGFILWLIVTVLYLALRIAGDIDIKPNKFTQFWFDKKNEEVNNNKKN